MPRRPSSRSIPASEPVHVMGDHVLFHNTSTAKRFPFLSSVPQHELANMFRVPLIDREEEKRRELQYSEQYVDPRITFRTLSSSALCGTKSGGGQAGRDEGSGEHGGDDGQRKPPFIPTNAASAKHALLGPLDSVFIGTYHDALLAERNASATSKASMVTDRPFTHGGSALAASELLRNEYFLNAMDSEIAQQLREMTRHRIKVNREVLQTQGYGTAGSKRLPNLTSASHRSIAASNDGSRTMAHHSGSRGGSRRPLGGGGAVLDGPRPMSGNAAPSAYR